LVWSFFLPWCIKYHGLGGTTHHHHRPDTILVENQARPGSGGFWKEVSVDCLLNDNRQLM